MRSLLCLSPLHTRPASDTCIFPIFLFSPNSYIVILFMSVERHTLSHTHSFTLTLCKDKPCSYFFLLVLVIPRVYDCLTFHFLSFLGVQNSFNPQFCISCLNLFFTIYIGFSITFTFWQMLSALPKNLPGELFTLLPSFDF